MARITHFGQEYRIHVRVMLEVRQDSHPFYVRCAAVNVEFAELPRILL